MRTRHAVARGRLLSLVMLLHTSSAVAAGWTDLVAPGRLGFASVLDPVSDRLVVFSGREQYHDSSYLQPYTAAALALDLANPAALTPLVTAGTPPSPRSDASTVYDPVRHRMLVFGGVSDSGFKNEVWALSLDGVPTWSQLVTAGTLPPTRWSACAVYDAARDRVLVFGGSGATPYMNDIWALSLAGTPTWTLLAPSGTPPAPRFGAGGIYDPVADRMVLFGGSDGGNPYLLPRETWGLDLAGTPAWTLLAPAGDSPGRYWYTAVYDPAERAMIAYGGVGNDGGHGVYSFALDTSTWTLVEPTGRWPEPRDRNGAYYDAVRDRVVVFGGNSFAGRDNAWALHLGGAPSWTPLRIETPLARTSAVAALDAGHDRMFMLGGHDAQSAFDETWRLDLATGEWHRVPATGGPGARWDHAGAFDPFRERVLVFGGTSGSAPLGDTWLLDVATSTWSEPPVTTFPPARSGHTLIADRRRDRMLLFGGRDGSTYFADVWSFDFASMTWTPRFPAGTPPAARAGHVAVYDPDRDRMLVFGGSNVPFVETFVDVWALSLTNPMTWTKLNTVNIPSSLSSTNPAAIYDTRRHRLVLYMDSNQYELRFPPTGPPAWGYVEANLPHGNDHAAVYDATRDRLVAVGAANTDFVYAFGFGGTPTDGGPSDAAPSRLALDVSPSPFRSTTRISYSLHAPEPVTLAVYDVRGTRVRSLRQDAARPAGSQTILWDARDNAGHRVAPGVYWIYCTTASSRASRRVVLLQQ